MNFEEYQKKSRKTAVYPSVSPAIDDKGKSSNFIYPSLGLAGEVGELLNKLKKIIRDKNLRLDEDLTKTIEDELGDILWYLSQLATEFDLSFDKIAEKNIEKLYSRLERDKIKGQGDVR